MPEFGKIVVFGTGLIGGSFALALKEAGAVEEVVGFGRTPSTLRIAQELGVIDRAGINPTHEIEDADIVLVATPVAQMPEIFERIAPYLGPNTIVTDGGSTKGDVVAAKLIVAEGASFSGHCLVGPDAVKRATQGQVPVVSTDNKVRTAAKNAPAVTIAQNGELENSLAGLESKLAGFSRARNGSAAQAGVE